MREAEEEDTEVEKADIDAGTMAVARVVAEGDADKKGAAGEGDEGRGVADGEETEGDKVQAVADLDTEQETAEQAE